MAQVIGSLPFMCLSPGLSTWLPALALAHPQPWQECGQWASRQQFSLSGSVSLVLSLKWTNFLKYQKKNPTKWILNLGMNRIKRKEKEVIQPCGRGRAATGQGPPVATGSGGGVFLLTPLHGEKPCWQLDLWPQELWEMDFSCFAPLDLWKICYSNHRLLTFF